MERQIITVDISPHRGMVPQLRVSQGDIGRPLGVYIMQDGAALDCSSYSADLYILKSDGNYYVTPATVDSTETNLIIWSTELQETPVAGECAGQIRITHGEDDIGTARFVEYVEASPGFSGAGSESAVESIKEYVRQAAASAETASGAASSATGSASAASGSASAAASSASAAAGSASSAHTDAETASQAAQTAQDVADSIPEDYSTLSEDVTGLKSALNDTNNELGFHSGKVVTNTASSIIVRESFSVKQGESVTVKCSYTGSNTTKYDLRFYASGTLHIIKTNIPFDEGYTFIAERDYDEIAIYSGLSQPYTAGNIFSWSGYISTGSIFKTNALEKDAAFYDSVIIDKTKVDKTNYYKNRSLMIGRVYKGVYDSGFTTIKCTDYIQIIPQHKYAVYGGFLSADYLYYFNRNKEIVATLPYENLITAYPYIQSSNHMIFTAPDDAGYIRINFLASNVSENIVPDGFYFVDITNDSLANIKVLVIGDSISADYYGGYPKWVTDLISEGYFLHPNVKNDSIHATGFVARYSSTDDDTFLTRIRTYNQNDYDWVVLFGGINDFIQSINYDTFKAAVDDFFQYLTANFYNKKICVFSPLRTGMTAANNAGHIQQDYQDYIKAVAKNYAIPVLNLTEESGFFPFVEAFKNQWTLLPEGQTQHDGVHPTEAWEKQFLVPIVKDFFRRFYE